MALPALQFLLQLTRRSPVPSETAIFSSSQLSAREDVSQISFCACVVTVVLYTCYILMQIVRGDIRCTQKTIVDWTLLYVLCGILLHLDLALWAIITTVGLVSFMHTRLEYHQLPVGDKTVLVTGCDRGIGHHLARTLDQLGFQVFAGCLLPGGEGEKQLIQACSSRLVTLKLDVSDSEQVQEAAIFVKKQLGYKHLWGIVNNAGICYIGNIETMTNDDIQKVMAVNFFGPVNICKTFLPLLRRGRGRLVNIASNAGLAPVPLMGIYCASKSALATMTEVWRYELKAWGIHVSTIIPSGYKTGILQYDKQATAERWWKSASETVRNDYGKECFYPKYRHSEHDNILNPDLSPIVNTITDALISKCPKTCYYRGLLARSLPFLYLHLPTFIGDQVMKVMADWFDFQPRALSRLPKR